MIAFILKGGLENSIYYKGKLSVSYIKPLELADNRYSLKIIPDDNVDYQSFKDIIFYEIDENELLFLGEEVGSPTVNDIV